MNYQEAIDKAQKLMRKGKDETIDPAEAALFLAKAQEVIDKFNLDFNDIDYDKRQAEVDHEQVTDFGYADPLEAVKDLQRWMLVLTSTVARANQCRTIFMKGCNGGKYSGKVKIVGRPSDVQTARYFYSYFKSEVLRLMEANTKGNSHTYKLQFMLGVVDIIYQKLNERHEQTKRDMRTENSGNSMALVRVDMALAKVEQRKADVDNWIKEQQAKGFIGKGRSSSAGGSSGSGVGGRTYGQQVGRTGVRFTSAKGGIGRGNAGQIGN